MNKNTKYILMVLLTLSLLIIPSTANVRLINAQDDSWISSYNDPMYPKGDRSYMNLRSGTLDDIALLHFSLASFPRNQIIDEASFNFYVDDCTDECSMQDNLIAIDEIISKWDASTVIWDIRPAQVYYSSLNIDHEDAYTIPVTSMIRSWYAGTSINNGIGIRDISGTNKRVTIFSMEKEQKQQYAPYIQLTYHDVADDYSTTDGKIEDSGLIKAIDDWKNIRISNENLRHIVDIWYSI